MSTKIYLVEDDPTIVSVVTDHLRQWGYQVFTTKNFQKVTAEVKEIQPEIVLLDFSLPYFNGFYWCQEIRLFSEVPILFISSAQEEMNQIMAMNLGADDYIVKPFALDFLVAKIKALLRRSYQFGQNELSFPIQQALFYPLEQVIRVNDQYEIKLTPTENRILENLVQHRGQVVSKEQLMTALWQNDDFIDNNILAVNLTRLRKKLAASDLDNVIVTVKKRGYLLENQ